MHPYTPDDYLLGKTVDLIEKGVVVHGVVITFVNPQALRDL